ncbi:hypothetical protein [Methylibium petroleiphilum]|uniref:Uncharacterized protein n=1 Tax=Methylibium petroleiphilum (strain ATCC BAA-1232 / LMG 22953 / PM1) TaxID=420662 RepID=A2SN45_METPP|nr:hypothetical protein [Methylibium petroleiphilum]ABM96984.1 hypothetical protein Mpe_B0209 [Methylibium petroleiphilum PM1]
MISLYGSERAVFLRRRRLAVERALRSGRPVADRAADIAMELLEDQPGQDRSDDRAAAAAGLVLVLTESSPQTVVSLAAAVLNQMEKGNKTALGGVYGRLMEAVLAIRRRDFHAPEPVSRPAPLRVEEAYA